MKENSLQSAGLPWTEEETSILQSLLQSDRLVSESFPRIQRGQDAIKRKWRKVRENEQLRLSLICQMLAEQSMQDNHHKSRGTRILTLHFTPSSDVASRLSREPLQAHSRAERALQFGLRNTDSRKHSGLHSSSDPHWYSRTEYSDEELSINSCIQTPRTLDHQISAACDDCRRRHKRCVHRVLVDFSRDQRPRCNRRGTDLAPGKTEHRHHHSSSGTTACILPSESSRNKENFCGNGQAARSCMTTAAPEHVLPMPRPPNLTKNGKRRGRPPRAHPRTPVHHVPTIKNPLSSDLESGGMSEYRPPKRRAIDDYEFSDRFEEVIVRMSATHDSNANSATARDTDGTNWRSHLLMPDADHQPVLKTKSDSCGPSEGIHTFPDELCKSDARKRGLISNGFEHQLDRDAHSAWTNQSTSHPLNHRESWGTSARTAKTEEHHSATASRPRYESAKKLERTKKILHPVRAAILNSPAKAYSFSGSPVDFQFPHLPFSVCHEPGYTSIRDSAIPRNAVA